MDLINTMPSMMMHSHHQMHQRHQIRAFKDFFNSTFSFTTISILLNANLIESSIAATSTCTCPFDPVEALSGVHYGGTGGGPLSAFNQRRINVISKWVLQHLDADIYPYLGYRLMNYLMKEWKVNHINLV